jgi:hypothetical protein
MSLQVWLSLYTFRHVFFQIISYLIRIYCDCTEQSLKAFQTRGVVNNLTGTRAKSGGKVFAGHISNTYFFFFYLCIINDRQYIVISANTDDKVKHV